MVNEFMEQGYQLALKAYSLGEVPVGCVIVKDGKIIASGYNTRELDNSVLGHAEINAIKEASLKLNNYRLDGCDMYVTMEPCIMCCGAIMQAHINKVYFAVYDGKFGGVESLTHCFDVQGANHFVKYQCMYDQRVADLLKDFFKNKRSK